MDDGNLTKRKLRSAVVWLRFNQLWDREGGWIQEQRIFFYKNWEWALFPSPAPWPVQLCHGCQSFLPAAARGEAGSSCDSHGLSQTFSCERSLQHLPNSFQRPGGALGWCSFQLQNRTGKKWEVPLTPSVKRLSETPAALMGKAGVFPRFVANSNW